MLDSYGYRHMLRVCGSLLCFSTATMVTRTRLYITFIRTVQVIRLQFWFFKFIFAAFLSLKLRNKGRKWERTCPKNISVRERYKALTTQNIKIMALRGVTPYSLVERYQRFEGICCLHLKERWYWQKVPSSRWYRSTKLHGATHLKIVILILISWPLTTILNVQVEEISITQITDTMGNNETSTQTALLTAYFRRCERDYQPCV
jgi:hypothetical protein